MKLEGNIHAGTRTATSEHGEHGRLLADIANAVVRVHKRLYGKGPVRARAELSQDLLTVLLEGGYTRGEQTLREHGHVQEVLDSRLAMQGSLEAELRVAVESLLLRSVRSFMSANDPRSELQVELFVLEPQGSEMLAELGEADEDGRLGAPARLASGGGAGG